MYDWRSKHDIEISGTVNENIHVWEHRSPDSSPSWGTWLALGLGAVGLVSALFNKTESKTPTALPPHPPEHEQASNFKLMHEFLKATEENLIKTGDYNACCEDLECFFKASAEFKLNFSEVEDFALGRILKRIIRLLKRNESQTSS